MAHTGPVLDEVDAACRVLVGDAALLANERACPDEARCDDSNDDDDPH